MLKVTMILKNRFASPMPPTDFVKTYYLTKDAIIDLQAINVEQDTSFCENYNMSIKQKIQKHKLSPWQVKLIRELSKTVSQKALASQFQVSPNCIYRIINHITYEWVK